MKIIWIVLLLLTLGVPICFNSEVSKAISIFVMLIIDGVVYYFLRIRNSKKSEPPIQKTNISNNVSYAPRTSPKDELIAEHSQSGNQAAFRVNEPSTSKLGNVKPTSIPIQQFSRVTRLPQFEIEQIGSVLRQIVDSARAVNMTTAPDVFFGRFNFILDALLYLQQFESQGVFSTSPTADYKAIINNIEAIVDDFIFRAYSKNQTDILKLKTDKGKKERYFKFANSMISAFDFADTFWLGNSVLPHYDGPLFTGSNYLKVKEIWEVTYDEEYNGIDFVKY